MLWTPPPPPVPMPTVIHAACPWQEVPNEGCFYGAGLDGASPPVVYVNAVTLTPEFVLEHELGHAYDLFQLSDTDRESISVAGEWRGTWNAERFANTYAACRLRMDPRSKGVRDQYLYGRLKGRGSVRFLCYTIRHAAGT